MHAHVPLAQPWVRECWDNRCVFATHSASFSSADSGTEFVISKKGSSSQLIWALRSGFASLMGRSSRTSTTSFNTEYLSWHHSHQKITSGWTLPTIKLKLITWKCGISIASCTHQCSVSDGWTRFRREIKQEIVSSESMRLRYSW